MSDKRPWTQEQDRALKFVFQTIKVTKWSHIARRLQEEFGVRGRNGKQCKERYTTYIDPSYPKQEWSYEQEAKMFQLHNEIGNKWAIIGTKIGGKTDNSVKNHFYSRLRKSLRKMNQVIQDQFRKQHKELKPNILYRIVQVSQERFKVNPSIQKDFVCFSNQLKNQLLEFSYDDEDGDQISEEAVNVELAKNLIQKINEFGISYKKKNKKQRKGSGYEQDFLTPHRYQHKSKSNQNDSNSLLNSSDMGNSEDISDDQIHRISENSKKIRRNSADYPDTLQIPRVRTRAKSQGNNNLNALDQSAMKDQRQELSQHRVFQQNENIQGLQVEGFFQGLNILQEEENLPPHPQLMKKQTSKYSRFSERIIEKQQYHFFEESQMEMRILPQMLMGFKEDSQYEESIFR